MRDLENNSQIVRNFAPSWFAMVMGTGVFAITSMFYSEYISFLKYVAFFLYYLNIILFFFLLIPWVLRWVLFRERAMRDLKDPVLSNFYATIAIAMLVLSSDFMAIGKAPLFAEIFWFVGVPLTVFFAILTPYIVFTGEDVKIDHINPAWFIPPVGLIVIPMSGSLLVGNFGGITKEAIIFFNYFGWGSGFFLYLSLLAVCMYRFILHRPLPSILAPTIWINLGPIGAGSLALVNIVSASSFIHIKEPFFVFALIFWGFGIWWFIMAVVMTVHYLKKIDLPYALSWWAFTFPLGAYVASSHVLSGIFNMSLLDHIGFALYWLLVLMWVVTFFQTAKHIRCGTIFRDPTPSGPVSAEPLNNGGE